MTWWRVTTFGLALAASLATNVRIRPRLESFAQQDARLARPNLSGPVTFASPALKPARAVFTFRGGADRSGEVVRLPGEIRGLRSAWISVPLNYDLHGAAKATPAVDDTGIYVGADTGVFTKYDHAGRVVWTFHVHTIERGIHATALLTDDLVYFGAYDGWFYALDKASGRPRWVTALGRAIGSSPILWQGALFVTIETDRDGFVAKLDAADGRVLWTSPYLGNQAHSSVTIDEANRLAIVGSNAANVTAIDLTTGDRRWFYRTSGEIKGTGALASGRYIFGGVDGRVLALESASGKLIWDAHVGGRILGNVAIDAIQGVGLIATASGLAAFDLENGRVRWRKKLPGPPSSRGAGGQTPVLLRVGGEARVLAQCAHRRLCVLDEPTGKLRARFRLRGAFSGSPTFFENHLYLAYVDQGLEAFELRY